jgi:2,4-dienoyl-CoA reductase (NADPH2)
MVSSKKFTKLLEPGYIGKLRLKNRFIKTGAGTGFIAKDGSVTDEMIHFYETIAKGGVGLIVFEFSTVEYPRGALRLDHQARLSDDSFIPGYTRLTKAIHSQGVPFFYQLMHTGAWWAAPPGVVPGDRILPSAIAKEELPGPLFIPAREMSIGEIEELIGKFADAAVRAQKANCDGVEINASHHHFGNAFFHASGTGVMTAMAVTALKTEHDS